MKKRDRVKYLIEQQYTYTYVAGYLMLICLCSNKDSTAPSDRDFSHQVLETD